MRWKKLGLIFQADVSTLPDWSVGFAQSPQTLVLEDRLRTYFSTRFEDSTGNYISRITYVDFDSNFEVVGAASRQVLPDGPPGTYSEHGVFPLHPVRIGETVFGYLGGWSRRQSVSVDGAIGMAKSSDDGATFEPLGPGPVLAASVNEPFMLGDPFLTTREKEHHMFYIFGTRWVQDEELSSVPERLYKIGRATSADGIKWHRHNDGQAIVPDMIGELECQAMPTVTRIGSNYYMLFCYRASFDFRSNLENSYRIGLAISQDLEHWERREDPVGLERSIDGWDSEMMCYPHVFSFNDKTYLMYNGNAFGRAGFGLAVLEEDNTDGL